MQWDNSKATRHVHEFMVFNRQIRCFCLSVLASVLSTNKKKKLYIYICGFSDHHAVCVYSSVSLWTGKLIVVKVGISIIALENAPFLCFFPCSHSYTWRALNCEVGSTLALMADLEVINCVRCWNSVQFFSVTLGLTVITIELLDSAIWNLVQVNISKVEVMLLDMQ